MLLSDWLDREGITRSDFAERIGVSPAHITGLCIGASWPGRRVVRAIERETAGAVTANDFVDVTESRGAADGSPETEAA